MIRLLITIGGGSNHAGIALQLGVQIARLTNTAPTVITVIKQAIDQPQADKILARAQEQLQQEIPEVYARTRVGHPAEEIIREAEEGHYDLVIVGEKQHHNLVDRFLMGSTAERVIAHAPCPVALAKGRIKPIQRILLCDSGADKPSLLDRFTLHLAPLVKHDMEITVLHVMSQISAGPGISGRQLRASAEELIQARAPEGELLARDVKLLEQVDLHPRAKIRHGLVVDEIVDEARRGDYDLVVIGAHRSQGWQSFLLDNLARQIIARADRPVLVVR
jgi:nucleotide-binding universal stress UspA family protein